MKCAFSILILPVAVAAFLAGLGGAQAQQVTNSMTCQRAISAYESQGRVYTRTRSGAVLPIYGGVPVSKGRTLYCGRDRAKNTVRVITNDSQRCVIAYRCL